MKNPLTGGGLANGKPGRLAQFAVAALVCWLHPAALLAQTIKYVQGNSATPQKSQTTVSVKFNSAQIAGDLNVVAVGCNDSVATVSGVTDTAGNAYTRAVGPTVISGVESQSIYYAKNIAAAAGANTVTVTFSSAAAYPDIRILEYRGADLNNPVDVTAASSGNSATSSSGAVTTTNPTDLLFGANMVQTTTTGPGSGFTSRLLTLPDGDIAEDQMVTATGSYSATAPLSSGQWIMQMVAFRTSASGGDTQPPTAPNGLTATVSGSQINLSWTASTDNVGVTGYRVERCQSAGCTTFAQIATPTATTYSDLGLGAGSYSYRVRATDAAGNLSAYSNVASGVIPDTQPPTAPGNLNATAASVSQINLAWPASADNVAVTGYLVERCQGAGCTTFAQIATPPTTAYIVTGLAANTSYSYRVRATDAAGNLSPYSNVASATTLSSSSTISYVQGNYATPQTSQTTVNVTFTAAQIAGDLNVVAVGWNDSTASVSNVTDTRGNIYTRAVGPTVIAGVESQSIYYAKNIAAAAAGANTVTVTFSGAAAFPDIRILEYSGADLNNPVDVTAASTGDSATCSSGAVTTTNPTDLIFGANIVQTITTGPGNGFTSRLLTTPDGDIAEDQMVTATGSYSATAPLSSGQWIMQMVAFRTSASGGDTQPPTAPNGLTATVSGSQINLSWTASTDNVGVTGYRVERCQGAGCTTFAQIATPTATTYSDLGLGAGSYSYRVRATDAAGNLSAYSNVASGVIPDTQPPTAPGNLNATAASVSQINLAWPASADNVAVTGYLVERCQGAGCTTFAQIATPPTTAYIVTGLAANTSYSYRVRATDAAGNLSPYSNVASATTLSSSSTISYVQGNYATPQTSQTTVNVTFTAAQIAGDLNVVAVGWNDSTATVSNVTDTRGNIYTRAVGPTMIAGVESQSIYYAKNIAAAAAGANTVTVTFSGAAAFPDIRILEYSGADLNNPVDVTAASTGDSATCSSGAVTTTNPTDLIFGANIVQTITTGPGNGFTSRLLTTPDGDIAEDQMVAATGSYSATAPLSSGQWIMQMVAFRTPAGGGTSPSVNLSSTNLTFGNVQTGSTSSLQPVTLTNVGGGQLTISSIAVVGGNAGDFAQTNTCGTTVAPNAACTINVTFTPTATGARSSTVTINDNAPGSPQTIALSGTGTGFSVTPRVSVLTFTGTQQFTASSGSVTWSVDGVVGGSSSSGTINTTGLYTPPNSVGTHVVTAASAQSANATVYITNYPGTFTYHNDNLRTGQNLNETVLTPANVNQAQFGKLYSYPLDGIAFASPLYVANVNIPAQGFHNVVYVATEHDSVYAFDADGLSSAPLWKVSFLTSSVTPVPCADTGECGDIPTEIGITSTPVIDQASGTMYVVAKTKEGTRYFQRLHALDITTGAEKFSGPVVLQASVPGTGDGASGGKVSFDALRENQRSGLLLNNGVVYVAFASHGDQHPWHGWVLGYNATTFQQTMAYNVSPDGYGGGIWQSGGGLATDSLHNIFFSTGNGDFTANTGGRDYGDTVVKLSPGGSVVDYFTPHDQANLESLDLDLSSAGPVLLLDEPGPNPHLLITAGKGGTIYVINRDNMGHFQPNSDNQIVQSLPGVLPHGTLEQGNYSAPVFFNNYVYFAAVNDTLKAFQLTSGLLSAIPTSQSSATYANRGGSFAISANGSANGILWATQDNNPDSGVLHAYDAGNLANELYNSSQAGSRDSLDVASKFNIPLVANGKVFVASNGQLTAFGLLP